MTVDELISRLGGSVSLSIALGFPSGDVGPKRVRAWAARGSIPAEYWLAIVRHSGSVDAGVTLDALALAHASPADEAA
jgi:hypothetical protein